MNKIFKKQYINNIFFLDALKEYQLSKDKKIFNLLGKQFLSIAENITNLPNFINYSKDRKDDMVSDAVYFMVKYVNTYDVSKTNPFAFFSQIAFNAFKQNINKRKRLKEIFVPISYIENIDNDSSEE